MAIKTSYQFYPQQVIKVKAKDISLVPRITMMVGIIAIIGSVAASGIIWPHSGNNACFLLGSGIFFGGCLLNLGVWKDRNIEAKLEQARSFYGKRKELESLAHDSPELQEIWYLHTFLMLHEVRKVFRGYLWKVEKDGKIIHMMGTMHARLVKHGEENERVLHPFIENLLLSGITDLYLETDLTISRVQKLHKYFIWSKPMPGYGNSFKILNTGLDYDLAMSAKEKHLSVHSVEDQLASNEASLSQMSDKQLEELQKKISVLQEESVSNDELALRFNTIDRVQWGEEFWYEPKVWEQFQFISGEPSTVITGSGTYLSNDNLQRNRNFISLILSNFNNSSITPFYAFGCGHFFGDIGIPALLEKQGCKVTRIPLQ